MDFLKASKNNTDEFLVSVNGGKAIECAEKHYLSGERFIGMCILKGIGLKVKYTTQIEFVRGEAKYLNYTQNETIYAKIVH